MTGDSNQTVEAEPESMPIEEDLSEKGETALLYIAKHEDAAQHDVKELVDATYQLLNYHFDRLEEKYLIRTSGKKEVDRGPDRKTYEATIAGLLYAYTKDPENPTIREKLERRVPLVLGKRKHFKKQGVAHIVLPSFQEFSKARWGFCAHQLSQDRPEEKVVEELTKHFFTQLLTFGSPRTFLWRRATGSRGEEISRIGAALSNDEELREITYPIIENLHGLYRAYEKIKDAMERKDESDSL